MTKSVSSHDELLRLITTNRISLRQTQYTVGPVSEYDYYQNRTKTKHHKPYCRSSIRSSPVLEYTNEYEYQKKSPKKNTNFTADSVSLPLGRLRPPRVMPLPHPPADAPSGLRLRLHPPAATGPGRGK